MAAAAFLEGRRIGAALADHGHAEFERSLDIALGDGLEVARPGGGEDGERARLLPGLDLGAVEPVGDLHLAARGAAESGPARAALVEHHGLGGRQRPAPLGGPGGGQGGVEPGPLGRLLARRPRPRDPGEIEHGEDRHHRRRRAAGAQPPCRAADEGGGIGRRRSVEVADPRAAAGAVIILDELGGEEGGGHAQDRGIGPVVEMLIDIFFEPEVPELDRLGAVAGDLEHAARIIVDIAMGEDVAGIVDRIAPGEGELLVAAGAAQQMVQPVVRLPAAGDARMDDRLADQHVGKDVGPERAREELAAMAADRAAGLGGHGEILAANGDAAIGEVLPDLVGDIEMGAEPEGAGGRRRGQRRSGRNDDALPHRSFLPRNERNRRWRGASQSPAPARGASAAKSSRHTRLQ